MQNKIALNAFGLFFLISLSSIFAQENRILNYSIVGSADSNKPLSFGKAITQLEIQKLLLELAKHPLESKTVDSVLSKRSISRKGLVELGLIREDGDRCILNFTLFTAEDIHKISEVTRQFARSLASEILLKGNEIEKYLKAYSTDSSDIKAAAFIILGCRSLDWDGLTITAEKDYRLAETSRPDGDYVPYAEEISPVSHKKIYCSSASVQYGDVKMITFGDGSPSNDFFGFLNKIKKLPGEENLPLSLKPSTPGERRDKMKKVFNELGNIMFALREHPCSGNELSTKTGMDRDEIEKWLSVLSNISYIKRVNGKYSKNVPVFTKRDAVMIDKIRDIGKEIMIKWLEANYQTIKSELYSTAPVKNGVPFEESFTMIWHFIFGYANNYLVESGLFADPYSDDRVNKGSISVIFHKDAM